MEQPAISILNKHRIMAISTVRPDGWPQTTVVGYANQGFDIFFLIFRASQKFGNIQKNDRISIAVTEEPRDMSQLQAVYAGGQAREITDPAERDDAWRLLMQWHSNLAGFHIPDAKEAAFMRAQCKYISVLDFTQGPGHREQLIIDESGRVVEGVKDEDEWTLSATAEASEGE